MWTWDPPATPVSYAELIALSRVRVTFLQSTTVLLWVIIINGQP